uniref:V2 n=1 Tax=Wild vitis virus 1 TaxID=2025352 RepID=A0A223FPK5_9GEMI|nr:V2 [Wild vitis virus 1]
MSQTLSNAQIAQNSGIDDSVTIPKIRFDPYDESYSETSSYSSCCDSSRGSSQSSGGGFVQCHNSDRVSNSVFNELDDYNPTLLDLSLPAALWFLSERYLSSVVRCDLLVLPGISSAQCPAVRRLLRRVSRRNCSFHSKCEEWAYGCLELKACKDGIESSEESSEKSPVPAKKGSFEAFARDAACSTS